MTTTYLIAGLCATAVLGAVVAALAALMFDHPTSTTPTDPTAQEDPL
jgi:hypothetical protein